LKKKISVEKIRRRPVREKRVEKTVTYEQIIELEKLFVPDVRHIVERTKPPIVSRAIATTYLRPMYLLGMRPSEPALFVQFISGRLRAPESAVESGC
jgi:integrase